MKKTFLWVVALLTACTPANKTMNTSQISNRTIETTIRQVSEASPTTNTELIRRGVMQTANFWLPADGTEKEFTTFCVENYIADSVEKALLFDKLQRYMEIISGNYNKMGLELKEPIQLTGNNIESIDEIFGAYDPSAHFREDMFNSKIAFITTLNFPFYTLDEKNTLGKNWNRREWAYARMGDMYTDRMPANIGQQIADALSDADNYISSYNIVMANLLDENGQKLFPEGMKLISHWGLRDELKSDYADSVNGLSKQHLIYQVMKRIVEQDIPQQVIDNETYMWNPYTNTICKTDGTPEIVQKEPDTRYQKLLHNFLAQQTADAYSPAYPTCLQRAFDEQMEVSYDEIEDLFTTLISSEQVKQTAALIEQRLGRQLEPFDIWYDGFKSRSNIPEEELSVQTRTLYPNTQAFEKDMPNILQKMGFDTKKSDFIADKITVDASRGAGHAWGATMRSDKSHLRTRIAPDGMDYKGYNIAIHEFGHNVEQTITLHDVDNYTMSGVPNTAFTEALAFVFQKRDLELLGRTANEPNKEALKTLDIFWGCYEIMGVSLVDMYTWKWLYEHPKATAGELKEAVLKNARDIWNRYYAPVLGEKDSPILAIYSHMIDYPLYLPNYPYGHLIEFQLEKQFAGKNIGSEIQRIYPIGRVTPNKWMLHATGQPISVQPLLEAAKKAAELL